MERNRDLRMGGKQARRFVDMGMKGERKQTRKRDYIKYVKKI